MKQLFGSELPLTEHENGTKERLLDAAGQLFASQGPSATSIRQVTTAARANLAAVHYHFGSKLDLLRAVMGRHVAPLNADRLRRLGELERAGSAPDVESIIRAYIEPILATSGPGYRPATVGRLLGRLQAEPPELVGPLMRQQFEEVARRFLDALSRALPDVPRPHLYLRFCFLLSVMVHVASGALPFRILPEYATLGSDGVRLDREILAFLAAGFETPASPSEHRGRPHPREARA